MINRRSSSRLFRNFLVFSLSFSGIFFQFQIQAQESQEPLDKNGKVLLVDPELEKELDIFAAKSGLPGTFSEAVLYNNGDGTGYTLEIVHLTEKKRIRKRIPLTKTETETLRSTVTTKYEEVMKGKAGNQEGRNLLLAGSSILSLAVYGSAIPTMLDVHSERNNVALYLLTAGSGFFLPFYLTQDQEVTDGMAYTAIGGGISGAAHGGLLNLLLSGSNGSEANMSFLMTAFSISEGVGGYFWAEAENFSVGTSDMVNTGNSWGFAWSAMAYSWSGNNSDRVFGATLIGGSAAGTFGGYTLAKNSDFTRGDAITLNTTGLLGLYYPIVILRAIYGDKEAGDIEPFLLGGSMAGLGVGYLLVRNESFSTGEGGLIFLGTAAGGLFGAGTAYYFTTDNISDTPILITSAVTATASYGFLYTYFRRSKKKALEFANVKIHFHPETLLLSQTIVPESFTGGNPTMRENRDFFSPVLAATIKL